MEPPWHPSLACTEIFDATARSRATSSSLSVECLQAIDAAVLMTETDQIDTRHPFKFDKEDENDENRSAVYERQDFLCGDPRDADRPRIDGLGRIASR